MTKKDGSILFEDLYLYSGFLFLGVLHGCTLLILTGRFICVPSSLFRFFIVCLHHKFLWKEYNWALILNWKSLIIIFILLTTISYYMTEKANKGIWCISFSLISIWQDFFISTFKFIQYSSIFIAMWKFSYLNYEYATQRIFQSHSFHQERDKFSILTFILKFSKLVIVDLDILLPSRQWSETSQQA